jgi:hypothetical protein
MPSIYSGIDLSTRGAKRPEVLSAVTGWLEAPLRVNAASRGKPAAVPAEGPKAGAAR